MPMVETETRLELRITPELRRLIRTAAGLANMNSSEWVRSRLERDARQEIAAGLS